MKQHLNRQYGALPKITSFGLGKKERGVDCRKESQNQQRQTNNQFRGRRRGGAFQDWIFGTEELSAHSECLQELEAEPAVYMHTDEAKGLGLNDASRVVIQTEEGGVVVKLKVVENMATGVLVVPRHRKLAWQYLGSEQEIRKDSIREANGT